MKFDVRRTVRVFAVSQLCILAIYWLHLSRQRNRTLVSMEENLLNGLQDHEDMKRSERDTGSTSSKTMLPNNMFPYKMTRSQQKFPANCVQKPKLSRDLPVCQPQRDTCRKDSQSFHADYRVPSHAQLIQKYSKLMVNGSWTPCDCHSQSQTAIIVPYNNTEHELLVWLNTIIPVLIYQRRAFTIFVIQQNTDVLYNRGVLLNIGIKQVLKMSAQYDCFIFHDVSYIPENLCNVYECSEQKARQLTDIAEERIYSLPRDISLGRAFALHRTAIEKTNGFTNLFYAAGCENYNMYARLLCENYTVARFHRNTSLHTSLPSNATEKYGLLDRRHYQCMHTWRYKKYDGINSVNYTLLPHARAVSHTGSNVTSLTDLTSSSLFRHITALISGPSKAEEVEEMYVREMHRLADLLHNDTVEFERVRGVLNEKYVVYSLMFSLREELRQSSLGIFKSFLGFVLGL